MSSRADNIASTLSLANFGKATELKQRILFTIGALIVFRFLSFVPLPGVNPMVLETLYDQTRGGILDMFNMFSGGSLERMSLIALGVMPYITASIVIQLASSLHPSLMALKKEGEAGRKKLNQYTRYGTVFLCAIQGWFLASGLEAYGAQSGLQAVVDPGIQFRIVTVINLVGGTMFLMWLGEQITARGVGNGVSLIIFAGIVAELPRAIYQVIGLGANGDVAGSLVMIILAMSVALTMLIVFVERAQRRLLVQYPKRQMAGGKQFGGQNSFLPLKINTAGVIPPIFASSLLLLPATAGQMFSGSAADGIENADAGVFQTAMAFIGYGSPLYLTLYGVLVIFFCFFYTSFVFDSEQVSDNLRKQGGFLPGIRPGARTMEYLNYVLNRLTLIGALYVAFVCVLPEYLISQNKEIPPSVGMLIGGMSLLIIVSVTIDTVTQIQSHLIAHQYEGLIKKSKMRRRRR